MSTNEKLMELGQAIHGCSPDFLVVVDTFVRKEGKVLLDPEEVFPLISSFSF